MTDLHLSMVVRSSVFLVCKGEPALFNHEGNCTEHHLLRLLLKMSFHCNFIVIQYCTFMMLEDSEETKFKKNWQVNVP